MENEDGVSISSEPKPDDVNILQPTMWERMTFLELIGQKTILLDRYDALARHKKKEEMKFYAKAIDKIDAIIQVSQSY